MQPQDSYQVREWTGYDMPMDQTYQGWGAYWGQEIYPDYVFPLRCVVIAWVDDHPQRAQDQLKVRKLFINLQPPLVRVIHAIVAAAGLWDAFTTSLHFSVVIENGSWMPLHIDSYPSPDRLIAGEKRRITVAHYAPEHGDFRADPGLEMTDSGYPIELSLLLGHSEIVWRDLNGRVLVQQAAKRDADRFAKLWANNLVQQGFIAAAYRLAQVDTHPTPQSV